jgi:hypothetical protein
MIQTRSLNSPSNTSPSSIGSQWVGFSTGALELGDYTSAVNWMVRHNIKSLELSALRFDELERLVGNLSKIPTQKFTYVSFHAPSFFTRGQERRVIELLRSVNHRGWNIIIHPDVIYTPARWKEFGSRLLIENMDRRKAVGRTADELAVLFDRLPMARLCLDVAHARQLDTTLKLLTEFISRFWDRVAEVHISELDSGCRHRPMSNDAVSDYQKFAHWLGSGKHVIIESMLNSHNSVVRMEEFRVTQRALQERPGSIATGNKIYIERRAQGGYAVRKAGSERASAIEPTQQRAIMRAREMNPGISPHVERVRRTTRGNLDEWRMA